MAPKTTECCILKGNGGNRWQISAVWNAQNPWICLISQNKNTDSFLFSPKQQLFLNFWKKTENFVKIWWFCQKCKAIKIYFFCEKKIKTLFRNRICHKILKFSSKIRQIRDLQRRTTSKNQCECFFVFFVFRKNIYTQRVFWIFFSKKAKNTRKSVLNWSKSPRFKHFEHV